MHGCDSWTIKKAECRVIDAFELWCWRRLMRVHWTARRSQRIHPKGNQSWIFIGRTDAEAETPILWPPDARWLIWKDPWCWERLKAGGEGHGREWDSWMASPTQWTWVWVNSESWCQTGRPAVLQSMGSQSWTRLSDWTEHMLPVRNDEPQVFFVIVLFWHLPVLTAEFGTTELRIRINKSDSEQETSEGWRSKTVVSWEGYKCNHTH